MTVLREDDGGEEEGELGKEESGGAEAMGEAGS